MMWTELSPEYDRVTLTLIATGVTQVYVRLTLGAKLSYPYPIPLQRGLNRLVLSCLQREQTPPQGIPDLLSWCQHPIATWGLALTQDDIGSHDVLLNGYVPTHLCGEWVREGPDIEADITESQLIKRVFTICHLTAGEDAYRSFRQLLIEKRVMTALEFQMTLANLDFFHLREEVRSAYLPAASHLQFGREYWCCGRCGNLLQPDSAKHPICENDRCRALGSPIGRRFPVEEGAYWLSRGLRRYVADPGIAEVQLAQHLKTLGLNVELWPAFDSYDLRLTFPSGESWAVDVKDWSNPFRLAREVTQFTSQPEWTQAYFVFPQERIRQRSDYVRAFRNHCDVLNRHVHAEGEIEFIKKVKKHLEKDHA